MTLKSSNFTLLVVNLERENLTTLTEELHKKSITAPDFFKNAPVVVNIEDTELKIDYANLKHSINEEGFILVGISGDLSGEQKELISAQHIAILRSSLRQSKKMTSAISAAVKPSDVPHSENALKTKIYTGRVRSGQQIYAKKTDLVINGDVGAGAEVIADGNIHIYGRLSGKALAGARGDKSACIFCQALKPELLSIAGIYKLSDDLANDYVTKSCMVSLHNEQIVLSKLDQV
ncbi:septum site-determining protein MinC [Psychromonas ingrahamii 37]|uniref:Probable septum site-determining protein MinC n=1 Tax=Psychromonas ingrahamii (strain DSM 17664 / CCUG 51855 / 37) TaxID=357804 RepID=A1STV1_PSYIN|nr:septum site-determining protein MinC [Psychromonas ingrahamii 37]